MNTFNTRIQLKYDSYENWLTNNPTPLKGEVCIATIPSNQDGVVNAPSTLIKIGDGTSDYKTLKFLSATAADVHTWAKAENKPSYEAGEITGIDAYIADYVNDQMGISVDTDTQYKIVKVDDYNYKLQSKGKTDEAWADVADSTIVIPNDTAAIEALQGLVGNTKVESQISAAIAALDLANTYEAKGEAAKVQTALDTYKTSNDAAMLEHTNAIGANTSAITAIKDGTTIDSFADVEAALAGKQATGDYATKTEAQGYANAKDEAIAAAQKAGDDAASAAATAQGEIDALEAKVGTVPEGSTVMGIITNIQENAYDDTEIRGLIDDNADAIEALEGLVGTTSVESQISTAIANEKLAETYAAKVHGHEIADVTGLADAIADAKKAGTDANAALETYKGTNDVAVKANADAIDAIEATIGEVADDKTIVQMIADAQTAATYDDTALAGRVTAAEGALDAIEADYLKAADKEALQAQINTIMNNPDAEGAINSINEFTQYVTDHGTIADGFRTDIDKNKDDIAALKTKVGEDSVADQIEAAIEALKIGDYAKAADLTAAIGRIAQNETDINALEGRVDTAEGKIATLETEVAKKANDADLAVVAKTGNISDLVQAEGDFIIFNCGTSSDVYESSTLAQANAELENILNGGE